METIYVCLFVGAFGFGYWSYSLERRWVLDDEKPTRKERRETLRDLWWGFLGSTSALAIVLTMAALYWDAEWKRMNAAASLADGLLIGGLVAATKRWNLRRKRRKKNVRSETHKRKAA